MQRTKQQWRDLIQAQSDSHLSIKQFCFEQNIKPSSFYKYKSTLKPNVSSTFTLDSKKSPTERSPFSQVISTQPANKSTPHEIKLNVGVVELTLDSNTDTSWLANLIGRLS